MNDVFNKQVKQIANSVDKVFYLVSADNLQLKEHKEEEIVDKFAKTLDLELWVTRSGPNVQNIKTLQKELEQLSNTQYEIIIFGKNLEAVCLLSYDEKNTFVDLLNTYDDIREVTKLII